MAKIIIVEDEAIVAMANKMMLMSLRHEIVVSTSSGEQAVQESNKDVDLILMDIKLKGAMDGIQAAEAIRKDKNTPILFITGNSDTRTKQRISNISNASVLQKPIMVEDLKQAINKLIHTN